jgi:membrane associated rhomboid family serine protease
MKERQSLTQSLIVVIVGSFLIQQYIYPNLFQQFALYGPYVKEGQYWRLFTVALLHAGWMHLIFNMLALWSIGTPVEQIFGRGRYLIIFIGSLLTASIGSAYFGPAADSSRSIRRDIWLIWRFTCTWAPCWNQLSEYLGNSNPQPSHHILSTRN